MSDQFVMSCSKCGAKQSYSPQQQTLKCEYCSSETEIPKSGEDLPAEISSVNVVVPLGVDKAMLESVTQGYMVTGEYTPDNLIEKAVITKQWLHYVPVYLYVGSYEARWTATFGYDRQEHYTEYVTKYENGRSYKVPETKTKTVTDWRPANGSDAGSFATHVYAGAKLPQQAIELIENMHMGDNKPQIFKQEFIAGVDVEEFTTNDDDAYSDKGQAKVNAIIGFKVRSHAQGDHQKDWHWTSQIDKKSLSALVPIAHSIFEYESKEYNVWIDGSDPSKLVGDTLPIDENKKSAESSGYIPLVIGVLAAIASVWWLEAPLDGQFWVMTIASLVLGYGYFYLRKEQMIGYSKALRNAYLNRKQADSADTSMMSAEDKDEMTTKFVKPSMPLFANTDKDIFIIPIITLTTFLLAIAPGYIFYKSMQPVSNADKQKNNVVPAYTAPVTRQPEAPQPDQPPANQNTQQQSSQIMSPKAQDLFNQANYAFGNKEYDKALTLLQVASGVDPNNQIILNAIDRVRNEQRAAINSMQIR